MSDETINEVEDVQPVDGAEAPVEEAVTEESAAAETIAAAEAEGEAGTETGAETEPEAETSAEEPAAAEAEAPAEEVAEPAAEAEAESAADGAEPAADGAEPATPAEEPAIDPARQAELDALAAELLNGAVKKAATRRKSRRVTAKDPVEFAERAQDKDAKAEDEAAATEAAAADDVEAVDSAAPADAVEGEESADAGDAAEAAEGESSGRSRSRRGRNRSGRAAQAEDGEASPQPQSGQNGSGQNGQNAQAAQQQSQRKRGRGRGGLGDDIEPEILEDDVLIPVAGILDVLENYAFVRTTGYLPGASDVYVSLGQVKKYGMRKGDAIVGAVRQPREGEQATRQKYNALVKVDSVSGLTGEQSATRPEYAALTPIRATEPTGLQVSGTAVLRGQRVLVVGGHASGKTSVISSLAEQAGAGSGESHLMVVLLGSRPEEITEFRRKVKGEVIAAGLEDGVEDEITIVELAVERAKRLVELGHNVVIAIDSIHHLGRAYASLAPSNRHGAEDPVVTGASKRVFGAARAIEDGATLTIIATAAEDTAGDRFLVTELSSLANAVVRL